MSIFRKCRKREKAFALISSLVLIAILSMLALEFSQRSRINLTMAINYADSKKALYYAYGGYQAALSLLDKDTNDFDGPGDFWYGMLPPIPIGEGVVTVDIKDEKARFNVRNMVTDRGDMDKRWTVMCERIFRALAIEPSMVYGIVDWQDTNDLVEQNGAEFSYYSLLTPSYEPRNGQFLTSGEILLVKEFDRDLLFIPPSSRSPIASEDFSALDNYITVYGDGKININTAQMPVLLSLSKDMDEYIAQDIIESREKEVFGSIEDLKKVKSVSDILYNEIRSLIDVKSDLFRITAKGVSGNFYQVVTAVVQKESKGFRVVYYNRSL